MHISVQIIHNIQSVYQFCYCEQTIKMISNWNKSEIKQKINISWRNLKLNVAVFARKRRGGDPIAVKFIEKPDNPDKENKDNDQQQNTGYRGIYIYIYIYIWKGERNESPQQQTRLQHRKWNAGAMGTDTLQHKESFNTKQGNKTWIVTFAFVTNCSWSSKIAKTKIKIKENYYLAFKITK